MKKIGRNEPCPCGSGKKFKHCHMGKTEDEPRQGGAMGISEEMSTRITGLPDVHYGRSEEVRQKLDVKTLTGSSKGIRFIDLGTYRALDLSSSHVSGSGGGGVMVNVLKTQKTDPHHIYVAISPDIGDSTLIHQMAHVLDYLGGSKLMPGMARPLSYDLGVPVEHLEHPREFGYWLDFLREEFGVILDAEDAIIAFLYEQGMLIPAADIERQDRAGLKQKSEGILRFLSEHAKEVDEWIRHLPGYIGPRTKEPSS